MDISEIQDLPEDFNEWSEEGKQLYLCALEVNKCEALNEEIEQWEKQFGGDGLEDI